MSRHDLSFAEKAVTFWTTGTLMALALASLALRYVTDPISCIMPVEFPHNWVSYAHQHCFKKTEIFSIFEYTRPIPIDRDWLNHTRFTYHHWVPFAVGLSAVLCFLPYAVWRLGSGILWMDAHALVQTVADNQRHHPAGRHVMLRDCAFMLMAGLKGGSWMLTISALMRKMVTFSVCVTQLRLILLFFQPSLGVSRAPPAEYRQFVEELEYAMNVNVSLPWPGAFLCDMQVLQMHTVQEYTFQCFLPIAQVYDKGFAFLFYLFVVLALWCLVDAVVWALRVLVPGLRDLTLKRYLALLDPQASPLTPRFLTALSLDGRLLLALIGDYCGPVAAADLTNHLWAAFNEGGRAAPPSSAPHPAPSAPHAGTSVPRAAPSSAGQDPAGFPLLTQQSGFNQKST